MNSTRRPLQCLVSIFREKSNKRNKSEHARAKYGDREEELYGLNRRRTKGRLCYTEGKKLFLQGRGSNAPLLEAKATKSNLTLQAVG